MEQAKASTQGRVITVEAWGDTAEAMEMDALDKARAFLGPDVQLIVQRNYIVLKRGDRHKSMISIVEVV